MRQWVRSAVSAAQTKVTTPVSAQKALDLTFAPIAIGQILASLEALTIGELYRRDGLLRGVSARSATPGTLRHKLLSVLDSAAAPKVLAALTLCSSVALLTTRGNRRAQIAASAVIGTCNRLNELRTPYGRDGADQMTAIITQYRVLSALVSDAARSDDLFLRAVNVQSGLSYFVSGVSKLFGSSWVQGDALQEILQTESYGGGPGASVIRNRPRLARFLTRVTPVWEAAFPLIYLAPSNIAPLGLIAVKGFHLGVAVVMELPRFVWGFAGSHGAVRYVLDRRSNKSGNVKSLERVVFASAAAVTLVCGSYATAQRQLDIDRRRGLKGTQLFDTGDGNVEYRHSAPMDAQVDPATAPMVVFEAGLGTALETWTWVGEAISRSCHVIAYHRRGYGLTTSAAPASEAVSALVALVGSEGPLVVVSHSIGLLPLSTYANSVVGGKRPAAIVLVDGTDPDLLDEDRDDRRRAGSFLQSQLGSAFMAFTGIYNFVPHSVSRQYAFSPDDQGGVLQFAFSPRNIYRAVVEYFGVSTNRAVDSLSTVKHRFVVSSEENAPQQEVLAVKLGAEYTVVPGSSHRSVLGYRRHAAQLALIIEKALRDVG